VSSPCCIFCTFGSFFRDSGKSVARQNVVLPGAYGARLELKDAIEDLGEAPDRFSLLSYDNCIKLKGAGIRFLTCYYDVLRDLRCGGAIDMDAALRYEISLALFCSMYATLYHNDANSLQSKINSHLMRLVVSMERTYKRARILAAIKRGMTYFGEMPAALSRQEDQVGKLVPHIAKKLFVLTHIAGVNAALVERVDVVVSSAISSTSTAPTLHAARAIVAQCRTPRIAAAMQNDIKPNMSSWPLLPPFPVEVNAW
jgi:hypothetical protein